MRSTEEHSKYDDDGCVYGDAMENYNDLHWVSYAVILGTKRDFRGNVVRVNPIGDVWDAVRGARIKTYRPEPEDD